MGLFKGTFWDRRSAYHTFYVQDDDSTYFKLGMREFNLFNWSQACQSEDFKKLYREEANEVIDPSDPLAGLWADDITFEYKYYDRDQGKYTDGTIGKQDLYRLLYYWEDRNKGGEDFEEEESKEAKLGEILTAPNKCVFFRQESGRHDFENEEVYVYFLEKPNGQQRAVNNDRFITATDGFYVTDVPTRPTGGTYSNIQTNDAQAAGNIGSYVPVGDGTNQPGDRVTGKVRLSYDPNTQTWGSQNQVLAILRSQLDSADIKTINLNEVDVAELDPEEFYAEDGEYYVGKFTTADAVVMSRELNNPRMYGPNFVDPCGDEPKIEVIRVVNRTNRTFKAGQTILCHLIDGEWIAQDFGSDPGDLQGEGTLSVGRWQFHKFFANTDIHFRTPFTDNDSEDQGLPVNPDMLESSIRYRTLLDILENTDLDWQDIDTVNITDLVEINLPSADVMSGITRLFSIPLQMTDFDQLGPELGGVKEISTIGRTNLYVDNRGNEAPANYYYEITPYWGAIFPDGFKSQDYNRVKSSEDDYTVIGSPEIVQGGASISQSFENTSNSFEQTPTNGMFSRGNADPNVRNLPASVGINGSWGETSSPIIDYAGRLQTGAPGKQATDGVFTTLLLNTTSPTALRYESYLATDATTREPALAMTPVNSKKVTFMALTSELACSLDPNSAISDPKYDRDFKEQAEFIFSSNGEGPGFGDSPFSSVFITRNDYWDADGMYGFLSSASDIIYPGLEEKTYGPLIVFDEYVQRPSDRQPINITVDPFYEEAYSNQGGNLVGILTARNVISKRNGGAVTIECECSYGMNGDNSGGSAGNVNLSIVMGQSFGSSSPNLTSLKIPAWGSTDGDDVDSFGTTALHVKVYDYWPETATHEIPHYFTVIHTNPGMLGSQPIRKNGVYRVSLAGTENANTNYRDISEDIVPGEDTDEKFTSGEYQNFTYDDNTDQEELYDEVIANYIMNVVDHKVPTYGYNDPSGGEDGASVPVDKYFTGNEEWRPESLWNIATANRGMIISGSDNGYEWRFYKRESGWSDQGLTILEPGVGYEVSQILDGPNGSKWYVLEIDGDTGLQKITPAESFGVGEDEAGLEYRTRGTGVTPSDIGDDGKEYTFTKTSEGKGGAKILLTQGKTYNLPQKLFAPIERYIKTKLSTGSGDGRSFIFDTKATEISLEPNNDSPFSGKYEFFYYFHNDISHTYALEKQSLAGTNPPNIQYITMSIN